MFSLKKVKKNDVVDFYKTELNKIIHLKEKCSFEIGERISFYEDFLSNKNDNDLNNNYYFAINNNNKIADVIYSSNVYGIEILYPSYITKSINILNLLVEQNPNSIIYIEDYHYFDLEFSNMIEIDLTCDEGKYKIYDDSLYIIKKENKNVLKEAFEKSFFFKDFDLNKVSMKVVTNEKLVELLKINETEFLDIPTIEKTCGNSFFCGFDYLNYSTIATNAKYLISIYENNVVGVIKIGEYGIGERYHRQTINYIDIRKDVRNQGLAKFMIKAVDNYLNPKLPLVITNESDLGKTCHIVDMFKTFVKITQVFSFEEFYEHFN